MSKIDNLELRREIDLWENSRAGSFKGAGNGFRFALNGVRSIISKLEAAEDPHRPRVKAPARLEVILTPEELL